MSRDVRSLSRRVHPCSHSISTVRSSVPSRLMLLLRALPVPLVHAITILSIFRHRAVSSDRSRRGRSGMIARNRSGGEVLFTRPGQTRRFDPVGLMIAVVAVTRRSNVFPSIHLVLSIPRRISVRSYDSSRIPSSRSGSDVLVIPRVVVRIRNVSSRRSQLIDHPRIAPGGSTFWLAVTVTRRTIRPVRHRRRRLDERYPYVFKM
jgi:hypothetical protein